MATKIRENIKTEAEALEVVTKCGSDLAEVPYALRTPAVVKKALEYSTSQYVVISVPSDQRTFEMVINAARGTYGAETKKFIERVHDNKWGISVTGMVALAKKGTQPNMSKVEDEAIKVVVYKHMLGHSLDNFDKIPTTFIEKVVGKQKAMELVRASGRNSFLGVDNFKKLPKKLQQDEMVIRAFQSAFLNYPDKVYSVQGLNPEVVTNEMYEAFLQNRPDRLGEIPEDIITFEMCEIAVKKNGNALKHVPEQWKGEFYKDVVKTGSGLGEIPEADRTDMLCTVAVENNPMQLKFVPEDKKAYALCLTAVDKNCEAIQFVPEDKIDEEVMVRFLTSLFNETYDRDYNISGEYRRDEKSIIDKVFDAYFDERATKGSYKRKEEMQRLLNIVIERDATMYFKLGRFAGESKGREYEMKEFHQYFRGMRNFDHAVTAAKKDISIVDGFSLEVQKTVWKFFINHEDNNQ